MNYKVLIIEDEDTMRVSLKNVLEKEGYLVKVFSDGREAIKHTPSFSPDIILCDIVMPDMDGFEVLKRIRKQGSLARTPFLFLSAKNEITDIRQGMNLGADDYLVKPFDKIDLLNAIHIRLERLKQIIHTTYKPEKDEILLIDDDPFHHVIYKKLLKELKPDFRYTSFVDPIKAIQYLRKNKECISCIFLDLIMPGMSGISFLNESGELLEKQNIDVYILSNDITSCDNSGLRLFKQVKAYIKKPLTREGLVEINHLMAN